MRLAFITQDFPPDTGGIQTYSFEMAKHLSRLCEAFVLIAPAKKSQEEVDESLEFPVIRISASNTLLGPSLLSKLEGIVKKYKITDTFHAQWQTTIAANRLKKKGLLNSVNLATHGREVLFNPFQNIPLAKQVYTKYQSNMLRKVDRVFPVSSFTAQLLQQLKVPTQKIHLLHNGTDPNRFTQVDTSELRKQMNLEGKNILFTICRHVDRKGIQDVLTALPIVLKQIPNLHYIIGGSGPLSKKLQSLSKDLGLSENVTFTGRLDDASLNTFYNLCDVFIMTPKEVLPDVEGFGIVYLEANACSKPVIGTISGGVTDAICHGKTGLLIERNSISAISNAIIRLMANEDLRARMGEQGRARVCAEMNWEIVSQKLYKKLNSEYYLNASQN